MVGRDDSGKIVKIIMVVNGEPIAQGRPRFSARGQFVRAYDPKKSRDYKSLIRAMAQEVYQIAPDFKPFDEALCVYVGVFRQIPKSFSKKKRVLALERELCPTTKPDISNYVKGIEDAVNGVLWKDDSVIVAESCNKFYSDQPRIELTVWTMG